MSMSEAPFPVKILLPLFLLAFVLQSCGPVQPALLGRQHPHEEYRRGLERAGLNGTALGRDWLRASEQALHDTVLVVTPFMESAYFPADAPAALGYRIQARRGERVRIAAEVASADTARVFMDVYELREGADRLKHVAAADEEPVLDFVAGRNRTYIVRVQPELLRSARVTVTITTGASLEFPVAGHDAKAIRSFFGDARDGGKRRHEGVDVFAPRGTPLISVSNGTARAADNRLGGKVVWVYDHQNNLNLYYAHLDSQYVGLMTQVQVGDTIGTVGNTGNAKHTPPHLHFGIYARGEGAVDPLPFLNTPLQEPAAITADLQLLETPARISAKNAEMRMSPSAKATILGTIPQHTHVTVTAASADWYRVRNGGGFTGYVRAKDVTGLDTPVKRVDLAGPRTLLDAPSTQAAAIRELPSGEQVELLAVHEGFQKVRTSDQQFGWLLEIVQ
jgi:peptidoglycan LD-endopeptidase LytH